MQLHHRRLPLCVPLQIRNYSRQTPVSLRHGNHSNLLTSTILSRISPFRLALQLHQQLKHPHQTHLQVTSILDHFPHTRSPNLIIPFLSSPTFRLSSLCSPYTPFFNKQTLKFRPIHLATSFVHTLPPTRFAHCFYLLAHSVSLLDIKDNALLKFRCQFDFSRTTTFRP